MSIISKLLALLVISAVLLSGACAARKTQEASDKEFLQRYGKIPATPEGTATIIDDKNRRAGRKDTTDYAQAYESDVTDGRTRLRVLEALDRGDVAMAKRLLITTMNVDAGFLPVYAKRAQISKKQQEAAEKFAKGYLDYLITHTNEIQVGSIDFAGCFIGLGHVLKDSPDDWTRLTNLVQRLDWPAAHKDSAVTNSGSGVAGSRR